MEFLKSESSVQAVSGTLKVVGSVGSLNCADFELINSSYEFLKTSTFLDWIIDSDHHEVNEAWETISFSVSCLFVWLTWRGHMRSLLSPAVTECLSCFVVMVSVKPEGWSGGTNKPHVVGEPEGPIHTFGFHVIVRSPRVDFIIFAGLRRSVQTASTCVWRIFDPDSEGSRRWSGCSRLKKVFFAGCLVSPLSRDHTT